MVYLGNTGKSPSLVAMMRKIVRGRAEIVRCRDDRVGQSSARALLILHNLNCVAIGVGQIRGKRPVV